MSDNDISSFLLSLKYNKYETSSVAHLIKIVIYIAKRKISAQCIMRKHNNKHIKSQQQGTAWGACVKECAWQLFGYLVDTQWEPSAHN